MDEFEMAFTGKFYIKFFEHIKVNLKMIYLMILIYLHENEL
jgi:hypothetical protein